jgi:hypothetical protein
MPAQCILHVKVLKGKMRLAILEMLNFFNNKVRQGDAFGFAFLKTIIRWYMYGKRQVLLE